ncbi:hypothetical protein PENSPDRAFT_459650 [Peniophora sp. CONT]|nr:hypothetical protein PENSPDRAFT_459650 [Peniophora sp. CONT]
MAPACAPSLRISNTRSASPSLLRVWKAMRRRKPILICAVIAPSGWALSGDDLLGVNAVFGCSDLVIPSNFGAFPEVLPLGAIIDGGPEKIIAPKTTLYFSRDGADGVARRVRWNGPYRSVTYLEWVRSLRR